MEGKIYAEAPTEEQQLAAATVSVSCLIEELRKTETGQKSRAEYIRTLDEFLRSERFTVRINVAAADEIVMAELIGFPLSELEIVGVSNDTFTRRGELIFESKDGRAIELSVLDLPSNYWPQVSWKSNGSA